MSNQLQQNLNLILQEKETNLKPEYLKKGITLFGVEGELEATGNGDVKLFETTEAMDNDSNPKVDDLAIVYASSIQNSNSSSEFSVLNFPSQVVLPQAVTDMYWCMLRNTDPNVWADGNIELSSNNFRFSFYGENSNYNIQYTSSDGITYNRTDNEGNPIDLGASLVCYNEAEWNDNFGYFIQISSYNFNGLYQYMEGVKTDNYYLFNNSGTMSNDGVITMTLSDKTISTDLITESMLSVGILDDKNNQYLDALLALDETLENIYIYKSESGTSPSNFNSFVDNDFIIVRNDINQCFKYNIATKTPISQTLTKKTLASNYNFGGQITNNVTVVPQPYILGAVDIRKDSSDDTKYKITVNTIFYGQNNGAIWNNMPNYQVNTHIEGVVVTTSKYLNAATQFNLNKANQLLPGKTALGKEGPITGDGSIYDNLDISNIFSTYYNNSISAYATYAYPQNVLSTNMNDIGKLHYLKRDNSGNFFAGNYNRIDITSYYNNTASTLYNRIFQNNDQTRIIASCGYSSNSQYVKIYDKETKQVLWSATGMRTILLDCIDDIAYYVDFTCSIDNSNSYIYNNYRISLCTQIDIRKVNLNTLEDTFVTNVFTRESGDTREYLTYFMYNPSRKINAFTLSQGSGGVNKSYVILFDINNETTIKVVDGRENSISPQFGISFSETKIYVGYITYPKTNTYVYDIYEINENNTVSTLIQNLTSSNLGLTQSFDNYEYINNNIYEIDDYIFNFNSKYRINKADFTSINISTDFPNETVFYVDSQYFYTVSTINNTYSNISITKYDFNIEDNNITYNRLDSLEVYYTAASSDGENSYSILNENTNSYNALFLDDYIELTIFASAVLEPIQFYRFSDNIQNNQDYDTLICNCSKHSNLNIPCMYTYKPTPPISVQSYDNCLTLSSEIAGNKSV